MNTSTISEKVKIDQAILKIFNPILVLLYPLYYGEMHFIIRSIQFLLVVHSVTRKIAVVDKLLLCLKGL